MKSDVYFDTPVVLIVLTEVIQKSELEESASNEFKMPVYVEWMMQKNQKLIQLFEKIPLQYCMNLKDMKRYEQDAVEMATEHLEMRKRVQAWHEHLRPILDEEEEKGTEFDIREYGTQILNRLSIVGEQKSFNEIPVSVSTDS
ncbi:Condensin-2 complex subunit H2, C-terminal [Cinara cedri]|uniref:Condensin-2 complex subunit H2, C-terminal n=1 Tax=Cinara cedri TaxID=506608 RepID=A0A5E4NSR1_9HEMI|nr:Condensin-2 complex subunit H2, C-terminal [Cinara cedri]